MTGSSQRLNMKRKCSIQSLNSFIDVIAYFFNYFCILLIIIVIVLFVLFVVFLFVVIGIVIF